MGGCLNREVVGGQVGTLAGSEVDIVDKKKNSRVNGLGIQSHSAIGYSGFAAVGTFRLLVVCPFPDSFLHVSPGTGPPFCPSGGCSFGVPFGPPSVDPTFLGIGASGVKQIYHQAYPT